jgi:hypothetical protein
MPLAMGGRWLVRCRIGARYFVIDEDGNRSTLHKEHRMQFLTLYTPAVARSGPPDDAHMAKMGKLMDDMFKAGALVATGGILSRSTGMKVVRKNGTVTVEDGPVAGSSLMPAAGYALLRANTREELVGHVKAFLEIAGDGTSEIIQVMDGPPPNR